MNEEKESDVETAKQRSGQYLNDEVTAKNVIVNNSEVVHDMGKGTDGDGGMVTESKQAADVVKDSGENTDNKENQQEEVKNGNISVEIKEKRETINPFEPVSNKEHVKDNQQKVNKVNLVTGKSSNFNSNPLPQTPSKLKKMKKAIFVSYSPDAGFFERKFVVETTRQLKENNLAEDIWFDKDEKNTDSPCWFSFRMEAVERCRAAILVLSESYFSCPVSVYEGKALIERQKNDPNSVKLFPVHFSNIDMTDIPKQFNTLIKQAVNLTGAHQIKLSLAEKTSIVIGEVMEDLERFATMNAPPTMANAPDMEFTGEYKNRKICQWNVNDLQEWLFKLGIKEFYRQSLAENMVDGFLLMSLTDNDMVNFLGIDSRAVRKKIMQQILHTLDKEHKQTDNWHLRARGHRAKPDVVYLIYDPADVRLSQNLKADLKKKGLQVIHHDAQKLGRSKEEFLQINGPQIASAIHVIVIFTEAAAASPFVFHEVLFADWLGKKLVTAMFKNIWTSLRVSLKAVLGDCPAIDFETKMYTESLDVLEHHIKPLRRVPGVVLEQAYLNKMADGLKPFEILSTIRSGVETSEEDPQVFISYQWDMQSKVEEIRLVLEATGLVCWADISMSQAPRGHSSRSTRSTGPFTNLDTGSETLQGQIQRHMKLSAVVLCCITPKYLQSDNCVKDLTLAETLNKPIIPLLLRFVPLESAPGQVRRILTRQSYVDLSNERLYKQNMHILLEKVKRIVTPRWSNSAKESI